MVAYSFQPQFVGPILSGRKRQTIRADRRRHARAGEELQLFTGMRTKQCRKLGTAQCRSVVPIRLHFRPDYIELTDRLIPYEDDLDAFARRDGFISWAQMVQFWLIRHGGIDAWSGVLIRWRDLVPAGDPQ